MPGRVSPKSRGRKVKAGRREQRRVRGNAARVSAGVATRPGATGRSPSGDVVNAVIERRVFAVPLPAERVDGLAEESDGSRREASELDAAVSGDRTLITVIEASARGVPQQRLPSFVTVVQQWDGDPLEVWQAARRLRDAGRSRDWVMDRLARTWDAHEGDDERYVATLKQL
jgi:hypothetical protein